MISTKASFSHLSYWVGQRFIVLHGLLTVILLGVSWHFEESLSSVASEPSVSQFADLPASEPVEKKTQRQILAKSRTVQQKRDRRKLGKQELATKNGSAKPGDQWIRIQRDSDGEPLALQTAIVRYRPAEPNSKEAHDKRAQDLTVDLIGAVHVGDLAYYTQLNRRFVNYDKLLYELVAPKGTVVEQGRGTSNTHPIGALQNGMKGILGLEHQLEHINYRRNNFVHADMSPNQLRESMDKRGESFMQMYFRLMGAEIARQSKMQANGKSTEYGLLAALFAKDRSRRIKIALAEQFENVESLMVGFNGSDGSTLITERNKVALKVLSQQIKAGRRNLGIFYGAGHLPDMDKRLKKEFHLRPVSVTWIDAWNLRAN